MPYSPSLHWENLVVQGKHLGGGTPQTFWTRSRTYSPAFRAGHGVTSSKPTGPEKHLPASLPVTAQESNFCDSQDAKVWWHEAQQG